MSTDPAPIRTPDQLTRLLADASTAAAVLRSPGHRISGTGERERIATLLSQMVDVTRRATKAMEARS